MLGIALPPAPPADWAAPKAAPMAVLLALVLPLAPAPLETPEEPPDTPPPLAPPACAAPTQPVANTNASRTTLFIVITPTFAIGDLWLNWPKNVGLTSTLHLGKQNEEVQPIRIYRLARELLSRAEVYAAPSMKVPHQTLPRGRRPNSSARYSRSGRGRVRLALTLPRRGTGFPLGDLRPAVLAASARIFFSPRVPVRTGTAVEPQTFVPAKGGGSR